MDSDEGYNYEYDDEEEECSEDSAEEVTMQGASCSLELRNIHTLEPFEAQHAAQTQMLVSVIELHEKKISLKVQKSY